MDRYIVYAQQKDDTMRVSEVWGPFTSYENAAKFIMHMNTKNNPDDLFWFGIRILQKTQIHKT